MKNENEQQTIIPEKFTENKTEQEKLREEVDDLKLKIDFMLKRMNITIKQEVKKNLQDEQIKTIIYELIRGELQKEHKFDDIVTIIIQKTLMRMQDSIKKELKYTKALCYSIDSEIKHLIRGNNFSYETDKKIEEMISQRIMTYLAEQQQLQNQSTNPIKFLENEVSE